MAKQENPEEQRHRLAATALRLLARREHSRQELVLKLRQRRFDEPLIDPVLDEFEQEGWLDDGRFADVYARQRIDQGYGPLRIQAELRQRGVARDPEVLEALSEREWCDHAIRMRERRFGLANLEQDWDEKVRQARFFQRRGFTSSQVDITLAARAPDDL